MPQPTYAPPLILRPDDTLPNFHELRRLRQQLELKYVFEPTEITDQALENIGRKLFDALHLADHLDQAKGDADILPILIESESGEIQALPWETLYHPDYGFLGRNPHFTLSRRIETSPPPPSSLEKGPLRILLFTSLPDDLDAETERLNVEEEQMQMQEALLPWIAKGQVDLMMPDDGRFSTFQQLLKKFAPHLVFLSGHGHFHHEPHSGEVPYGTFLFEDKHGKSKSLRDEAIAQSFTETSVQAVILSSCESGKAVSGALNDGLMQKIHSAGVPHVIGMRESLFDEAGPLFAHAISAGFAGAARVDFSLQAAREAIVRPVAGVDESFGQWVLPTLYSVDPELPLIDWDFPPRPKEKLASKTLNNITLPPRFVGRRAELRQYKSRIFDGELKKLLITGAGGYGKTSLAGKLAADLQEDGYKIFAWSAKEGNSWQAFESEMHHSLSQARTDRYIKQSITLEKEKERIALFLHLLTEEFKGKVLLFLDNLESVQDEDSLKLEDESLRNWVNAVSEEEGLIFLATSRWKLPEWEGEDLALTHSNYGDFLQMAERLIVQGKLLEYFLEDGEKMRQIYDTLGGNGRGLKFFASASALIKNKDEEAEFWTALKNSQHKIQENMAIEKIYAHVSEDARLLLSRLPAYHVPVPLEGILKLETNEEALNHLVDVSLVEVQIEKEWDAIQYQIPSLVMDWLHQKDLIDSDLEWRNAVADYQLYLFEEERETLTQAIILHSTLERAERQVEADSLALERIVSYLSRAGLYQTLLVHWLPHITRSPDPQKRARGLDQMGQQYRHLGNFDEAMPYYQKSLAIAQEIGDKACEGMTLNNIGDIFRAQGDYTTAVNYLKKSLAIAQEIGDTVGEGMTLNNIGDIFRAQGDYTTAFDYLKKSLAIAQEIGDIVGEGTTLNNIGDTFRAQGDYTTALDYLKKSLSIAQETDDKAKEGTTLNNIATLYHAQGDYVSALDYMKKTIAIFRSIGDKVGEGVTLNNIGDTFRAQGDYTTALDYLKKSLSIAQETDDKAGESVTLNGISQIYDAQGDYEIALDYLKKSLAIRQEIGDKAGEGTTLNNISGIYHAQGDYAIALDYLKESLAIMQEIGDKAGLCTTLFNMGHIHWQNGEQKEAVGAWVTTYQIAKAINYAQVLQALADLAPQLGLEEGLAGWERLSNQYPEGQ